MLRSSNLFRALGLGRDEHSVQVEQPVRHGPRVFVREVSRKVHFINALEVFDVMLLEWHAITIPSLMTGVTAAKVAAFGNM